MAFDAKQEYIPPGSWIGILGGGQLGRMLTHSAQRMGYHVAIYEDEVECPAGQVADRHFCATNSDESPETLIAQMADLCSVITLEFENVPTEIVRQAGRRTLAQPSADFLEICQDRGSEKASLGNAGFPVTPFKPVESKEDVLQVAELLGWPLVLKTTRSGYDGKGQVLCRSADELPKIWDGFTGVTVVAEKWVDFDAEVSMITARNAKGEIACYPLLENEHANHILSITRCPVSSHLRELESEAVAICKGIAEQYGVIGLFCVEFFVSKDGKLMINEVAPRPHNSGHLTIEAFTCSQFEQQLRAVCNLPLVTPALLRPAAMANLLGELWEPGEPCWEEVLGHPAAHLHLYGKATPRPGRKMGHLTVLDESSSEAAITAQELRDALLNSDG